MVRPRPVTKSLRKSGTSTSARDIAKDLLERMEAESGSGRSTIEKKLEKITTTHEPTFEELWMKNPSGSASLEAVEPIINALNNSKFRWRTIPGIAKETKLPLTNVRTSIRILQKNGEVIEASLPNKNGDRLYTTVSHYEKLTPLSTRVKSAFSGKIL